MYIPLSYAAKCKRNTARGLPFFVDNLTDDFLILAVAFVPLTQAPLATFLGLLLLHLSLWAIYEVGYFENDLVAATIEPDGKVPPRFSEFRNRFSEPVSWGAAIILGAAGIAVLVAGGMIPREPDAAGVALAGAVWLAFLIALRLTYRVYNRIDKASRVFLYLPLQMFKYGFGALFLPLAPAGAALIFSQILRRWVPYIVYRNAGSLPTGLEPRILRLLTFCSIWLLLLPAAEPAGHLIIGAFGFALLLARSNSRILTRWRRATSAAEDMGRAT